MCFPDDRIPRLRNWKRKMESFLSFVWVIYSRKQFLGTVINFVNKILWVFLSSCLTTLAISTLQSLKHCVNLMLPQGYFKLFPKCPIKSHPNHINGTSDPVRQGKVIEAHEISLLDTFEPQGRPLLGPTKTATLHHFLKSTEKRKNHPKKPWQSGSSRVPHKLDWPA